MRNKKIVLIAICIFYALSPVLAQDVAALVQKIKAKLEKVNDYEATGVMKTSVSFLKVPEATGKSLFQKTG